MCNLYSLTKGPQAIRDFVRATRSDVGNMPLMPEIFPDYTAPIVRDGTSDPKSLTFSSDFLRCAV
jgi:putative SOS response-associated peptidase YedK